MTIRIEKDSMGSLEVPSNALYGAQTQRAINNFHFSDRQLPEAFISALAQVKLAAAQTNHKLGNIKEAKLAAIEKAVAIVLTGAYQEHFPIDIFQTGSGTSTNMNMNEVLANIAKEQSKIDIHPNDEINASQSSNDVIPTTIHLSAAMQIHQELLPALNQLVKTLDEKEKAAEGIIKTGRTHLMDAMPISFSQEIAAWKHQILDNISRLEDSLKRLQLLPQGGTAVGTGINADPKFAATFCSNLSKNIGIEFKPMANLFVGISTQDTALEISGQLNVLAASLMKIANDLRWMNSGPLAGLAEIQLEALQPGSSIMPGKVNPVIPEAICMAAAQIAGNHTAITICAQSGNFQLNVMLPMIADNLLYSIQLATNSAKHLAEDAIASFIINEEQLNSSLEINPILVTALNTLVGYETGAAIAKEAYASKRPVIDVAKEMTNLTESELQELLNPAKLTQGGNP